MKFDVMTGTARGSPVQASEVTVATPTLKTDTAGYSTAVRDRNG